MNSDPFERVRGEALPEVGSSTSLTLLNRVKNREDVAWGQFVRLYGPLVYRWCRGARIPRQDSVDVVQDVLQAVARAIGRFRRDRPGDSFQRWLRRITTNKIRDYFRRRGRQLDALGGTTALRRLHQEPDPVQEEPSDGERANDLGVMSHRALEMVRSQFEDQTWNAFWRTAVEGQSPADVASDLQLSVWSVYQAKSRVLRRLRAELGAD